MIPPRARVATGVAAFDGDADDGTGTTPWLSEREQQVLARVADGATNREIAAALGLSPYTIKEYTSALYRKLDVRNRLEPSTARRSLG